jgi:hypothetical protein
MHTIRCSRGPCKLARTPPHHTTFEHDAYIFSHSPRVTVACGLVVTRRHDTRCLERVDSARGARMPAAHVVPAAPDYPFVPPWAFDKLPGRGRARRATTSRRAVAAHRPRFPRGSKERKNPTTPLAERTARARWAKLPGFRRDGPASTSQERRGLRRRSKWIRCPISGHPKTLIREIIDPCE